MRPIVAHARCPARRRVASAALVYKTTWLPSHVGACPAPGCRDVRPALRTRSPRGTRAASARRRAALRELARIADDRRAVRSASGDSTRTVMTRARGGTVGTPHRGVVARAQVDDRARGPSSARQRPVEHRAPERARTSRCRAGPPSPARGSRGSARRRATTPNSPEKIAVSGAAEALLGRVERRVRRARRRRRRRSGAAPARSGTSRHRGVRRAAQRRGRRRAAAAPRGRVRVVRASAPRAAQRALAGARPRIGCGARRASGRPRPPGCFVSLGGSSRRISGRSSRSRRRRPGRGEPAVQRQRRRPRRRPTSGSRCSRS